MKIFIILLLCLSLSDLFAKGKSLEKMAMEAAAAAIKSGAVPPSPEKIVAKVDEGCNLLKREGIKAFDKFRGGDSAFIFNGTYIWIHDIKGLMRVHPMQYKVEGKRYLDIKDKNGKRFIVHINELATTKGSGWVDYWWPKPGEKVFSKKVAYIKFCEVDKNNKLILGCGIYDLPNEKIEELVKKSR